MDKPYTAMKPRKKPHTPNSGRTTKTCTPLPPARICFASFHQAREGQKNTLTDAKPLASKHAKTGDLCHPISRLFPVKRPSLPLPVPWPSFQPRCYPKFLVKPQPIWLLQEHISYTNPPLPQDSPYRWTSLCRHAPCHSTCQDCPTAGKA